MFDPDLSPQRFPLGRSRSPGALGEAAGHLPGTLASPCLADCGCRGPGLVTHLPEKPMVHSSSRQLPAWLRVPGVGSWAGTSTEAPEWPAPLFGQNPSVARRAESRQLSQGLSQRRNGHQLGVAEGWDWSSGVIEAKEVCVCGGALPGPELLTVVSFPSRFCLKGKRRQGYTDPFYCSTLPALTQKSLPTSLPHCSSTPEAFLRPPFPKAHSPT